MLNEATTYLEDLPGHREPGGNKKKGKEREDIINDKDSGASLLDTALPFAGEIGRAKSPAVGSYLGLAFMTPTQAGQKHARDDNQEEEQPNKKPKHTKNTRK